MRSHDHLHFGRNMRGWLRVLTLIAALTVLSAACTSSTEQTANNTPASSASAATSPSPSPSPSPTGTETPSSSPLPSSGGSLSISSLPFHNGEVGVYYL